MDRDYPAAKLSRILSVAFFCKPPCQNLWCGGKDSDYEDVEFKHHIKNITYAYENGLIGFDKFKELVRLLYAQKKQEDKKDGANFKFVPTAALARRQMQYFEVILENGHMGAGNSYTAKRYFKGRDMLSVISRVRELPRIKKRHTIEAIKSIKPITKEEYIKGMNEALKNPHLFRVWDGYRCPICGERFRDIFSFRRHVEKY